MSRNTNEGTCALCQNYRKLCKSHLASNFLYESTFADPNGRAIRLSTERKDGTVGTGVYDYLLCEKCERHLNENLEQKFFKYWIVDGALDNAVAASKGIGAVVSGFDYAWFKLFHLSIFWRFAVSQGDYSKSYSIGPHAEKIRLMLLNLDPGPIETYPIAAIVLVDENRKVCHDIVGGLEKHRYEIFHMTTAFYGGCEWMLFLTKDARGPYFESDDRRQCAYQRDSTDADSTIRKKSEGS